MYTEIHKLDEVADMKLQFAVILARFQGKWVFVKHKQRETWEMPGGRREPNESISQTAARELWEESGAKSFVLTPKFDYSVVRKSGDATTFGRVFSAEINEFAKLPESEIGQVALFADLPEQLTYPQIQPLLFQKACSDWGNSSNPSRNGL